ncbi:MAG: choice-of-anchor D domain-containing protein [Verrucomicrobiota bacterium]|nr:choice-of-anchor D domain-containing protein [Verrucomicrobiota bacterium]
MKTKKPSALYVYRHGAIALIAAVLCSTASVSAQSILGSASNFALLGGTAITSTGVMGTTILNGNIGLSPASESIITGFPPAVVVGGAIIATGPVTLQARLDLIKAQVALNNMPSNANLTNVDLAGMTLAPGVYTFNSEAQLNGDLVLDAQGKNAVFWVFQIGTAFTSAMGSKVKVINPGTNGGTDVGIFWNCGSAVNIGGNNQMAGIYIAGTSMTFGGGATGGGRALTLAGISLDNNQFDAKGGPGGTDWSGGLIYDAFGNAVPISRIIGLSGNLAFGELEILQTAKRAFVISNTGNSMMTVSAINYPTGFSGNWDNGTVAAGGTQTVEVTFSPTVVQNYGGMISVITDKTDGVDTIPTSGVGTPIPTRIIVLAGNLEFGNVIVNQTATQSFTISNDGNTDMTVTSIGYPAGYTGDWSNGIIASGGNQTVNVTFSPVLVQSYNGTITVNADMTSGTNTIIATGTGVPVPTRIINMTGNLAFGNVEINKTATQNMTISNTGNSALTVTSVTYPNGFSGNYSNGIIAAGGNQVVTVTFSPTLVQSYSGTVTVNSDMTSGSNTLAASGSGTPIPTRIIGVTGSLAFGDVEINTTATQSMTITNTGNTALAVTSITYPSGYSGNYNSGTIAAGGNQVVTVTFSPTLVQNYSGTVTVNSDMTSGTNTLAASGSGTAVPTRIIGVTGSLAFGNLEINKTATLTYVISNTGNTALAVTSVTYPSGFTGNFNSGTIAIGGSQTVTVTFSPTVVQSYSGTVTVNSDKTSGTNTLAASGTGTAVPTRIIGVTGNLAFGNLEINKTATLTYVISNTGNTALAVTSVTYPSGFSGNYNSGTIAIGGSQTVTVTFSPTVVQSYSGTVTVNSDMTSGTNTLAASGTGTAVPTSIIGVTGNLAFGNLEVNQTATQTFTISNTGNTALVVSSVTYPGGFTGNFNSGSIAAGGSQLVTVTFAPTAAQSYSGVVTVNSNQTSGTNTLAIAGTGTAIPTRIILLNGSLFFGELATGQTATQTFSVSNTGNTLLTVTALTYPAGFTGDWNSGTIAAGGTQLVTVTFSPVMVQSYSGLISVTSDKTSGTNTISVSGAGTLEATRIIALSGNLYFGHVGVGHSSTRTFTISNTGNSPLTVNSVTYPVGYTGDWNTGTIPAGGSQVVVVTFSPLVEQTYGGIITVTADETSGINTLACPGAGCELFLGTATGDQQLHRFGPQSPYLWSEEIGFLYDGAWPFVFDYGAAQWLFVFCSGADEQGYYLYDFSREEFGYASINSYPYYWLLDSEYTLVHFGQ